MSEERSSGGIPIYRHTESAPPADAPRDAALAAAVDRHVREHFGPVAGVWQDILPSHIHVELQIVAPSDERPVTTVVTSGMSARPMQSPDGPVHAELMLLLPPSWPTPAAPEFSTDAGFWPYQLLLDLARIPHEYGFFLWIGHTVPNDDPPRPYAGTTKLCGALVGPMLTAGEGADSFVHDGHEVHLLAVVPLYADEMQYKLDHGEAFYELCDRAQLNELLDPERPSIVPRRRWFSRR